MQRDAEQAAPTTAVVDAPPQPVGDVAESTAELGRLGQYRLLDKLGQGGMGIVFLAADVLLQRRVALKTMLSRYAASSMAKERFLREARAVAKLEHENIVAIYQVGEEDGVPFLAMPVLRGMSLDRYLKERPTTERPIVDLLDIARQIATGLAAAHAVGLTHRDVKPANIWLERKSVATTCRVKILDFGLARTAQDLHNVDFPADSAESSSVLTHSGAVLGTPAYMAPEQARGERVDFRADLFSFGCILFEMTTGNRPFAGPTVAAILAAIETFQPPAPKKLRPDLPEDLSNLIERLLEKNPAQRPASTQEVAEYLAEEWSRRTVQSQPIPATTAGRMARRSMVFLAVGAIAMCVQVATENYLFIPATGMWMIYWLAFAPREQAATTSSDPTKTLDVTSDADPNATVSADSAGVLRKGPGS